MYKPFAFTHFFLLCTTFGYILFYVKVFRSFVFNEMEINYCINLDYITYREYCILYDVSQ